MKVLLVDDERHVREAIKLLVDWEELGIVDILEADNGEDAMAAIEREAPDIVITDMRMPLRDGVELLAWMKERDYPGRRIVVSGHDDFHLVRSTMKYGGQDYLLKPVDPEQLREALGKAVASLEQECRERRLTQKRNIEMNRLKPVYWDKIFSNLVTEPASYGAVRETLEEEFKLGGARQARVVILSLDTANRIVMSKYSRNRDLLFFTVTNVCNEFLRAEGRAFGFACRSWNSENEALILLWERHGETAELLERIEQGFEATLKCRFDLGVGLVEAFPDGLPNSYESARAALKQRHLHGRDSCIYEPEPGERGRDRNVMADIARYIEDNYDRELTLADIASQFYLSREYISRRFKQEFGENLSDFLGRIRIECAKLLLANPLLRIADIAERVGFSDEKYFSKVFKKLEGVSPNQYRKSGGEE